MPIVYLLIRVFEMGLRLGIGIDIARGMRYLHELVEKPVIHRDLNSHNVLLHNNGRAVVGYCQQKEGSFISLI
jgi:serine/threonine protein kinase